jgi:tRNA modification GTPase
MQVVIAGAPNVGKSSLLNRLSGEDLAIVTDIPGTTRDAIRQVIDIGGMPLHVIDTAGLRDSNDVVERIGIERTWAAIGNADCVLHVVDAHWPEAALEASMAARLPVHGVRLTVINKIDLTGQPPFMRGTEGGTVIGVSAKTGDGLALLRQALMNVAGWDQREEGTFLARERHLRALELARTCLDRAASAVLPEIVAEELRLAHEALASLTGAFTADDLLGEIFQRFCIGK